MDMYMLSKSIAVSWVFHYLPREISRCRNMT